MAKLVVIGGGNMGAAIVAGAIGGGGVGSAAFVPGDQVIVCEPDERKRRELGAMGVRATGLHAEALAGLADGPGEGFVLLAVKPQALAGLAEQIRGLVPPSCGVISILAGTPIAKLAALLGRDAVGGVIRAMPNTAVRVRAGVTALADGKGVSRAQSVFAAGLFGSMGEVVRIDESLMDAFTALAGSGPAYVYYLAEAMMKAGAELGFDEATSDRVVRATVRGAAALLGGAGGEKPVALRAAVTSKGGTTEAAVGVLEEREVMRAIVDAIVRGRDRGRELGG